jgi:hypothetical protein
MRVRVTTTADAVVTEEWLIEAPTIEAAQEWFDGAEDGVRVIDVRNLDVTDERGRVVVTAVPAAACAPCYAGEHATAEDGICTCCAQPVAEYCPHVNTDVQPDGTFLCNLCGTPRPGEDT